MHVFLFDCCWGGGPSEPAHIKMQTRFCMLRCWWTLFTTNAFGPIASSSYLATLLWHMLHCCGVLLCISKVGVLLSFHYDFYQVLPFFKLTLSQLTLSPRKNDVRTQKTTVALRLNLNLHQHRLLPPRVMPQLAMPLHVRLGLLIWRSFWPMLASQLAVVNLRFSPLFLDLGWAYL